MKVDTQERVRQQAQMMAEPFFAHVLNERLAQNLKWGLQEHSGHTWVAILTEELGEFAKAVNDEDMTGIPYELIQVAAVACAAWEQMMLRRVPLSPAFGKCSQTPAEAKQPAELAELRGIVREWGAYWDYHTLPPLAPELVALTLRTAAYLQAHPEGYVREVTE